MWVEQEDSGRERLSALGGSEYALIFETNRGDGKREVFSRGYKFGTVFIKDGVYFTLSFIDFIPHGPNERVDIIYRTRDYQVGSTSRDGRIHREGDEEFEIECATEQLTATQALNRGLILRGTTGAGTDWEDAEEARPLAVPYIVWRKWLPAKGEPDADGVKMALPTTLAGATEMALTYTLAGHSGWEQNGPIVNQSIILIGALPPAAGTTGKCTDVRVIPDGKLLLREARLQVVKYVP